MYSLKQRFKMNKIPKIDNQSGEVISNKNVSELSAKVEIHVTGIKQMA